MSPFLRTTIAFAQATASSAANAGTSSINGVSTAAAATHHQKSIANARLQAFRHVVQSRVSARRFEPNKAVPDGVWRDILKMTLVSA